MHRSVSFEHLPPPVFFSARQVRGVVEAPGEANSPTAIINQEDDKMPPPPTSLERSESLSGNILLVQTSQGDRAYWLQRKLCKTTRGHVRLGYPVSKREDTATIWTVEPSNNESYPFEMVAIKIQDKPACEHTSRASRDPQVEFSALQLVAASDPEGLGRVVTGIVCADDRYVYTIMPYFGEGSLAEYIAECGRLDEGVARHFFQQIISGLSTLKQVGLCHHDLSLESVLMRGTDCFIVGLGLSLRVPMSEDGQSASLLGPQASCGTNLLYLAPEILQNVPFDGFASDLWAVGIMLSIMLFGTGAPFVWASPDDKRFREIALKGNLREVARKWEARNHGVDAPPVSEEALDLLQCMLRANPAERLTLEGIQGHAWFLADATLPQMSGVSNMQNLG